MSGFSNADDVVLVISNAPDLLLAKRIAHMLVEEHLAACVNLGQPGLSLYMWQGVLQGTEEIPLCMKTVKARLPALQARLCELHPYEVPEFLVLQAMAGLESYVSWVREQASGVAE